jgi:hypothetical protein
LVDSSIHGCTYGGSDELSEGRGKEVNGNKERKIKREKSKKKNRRSEIETEKNR